MIASLYASMQSDLQLIIPLHISVHMMSALFEGISRLHVLHILHRDLFSVLLVIQTTLAATNVVCHSFLCLLRQQQQIFCKIKYTITGQNDCTMTYYMSTTMAR